MEGVWVPLQAGFDGTLSLLFMVQVVETIITVAVTAELSIRKTITISEIQSNISTREVFFVS